LGAALVALMMWVSPASAQVAGEGDFNEGMRLLSKGDYDGACAAFERSEVNGPTMASRYQLGRCNEERSHFGSAYLAYLKSAELAEKKGDTKRAAVARQRARELEDRAPKLVFVVPPANLVQGLTIKRNGASVPNSDWGKAIVIEEGQHNIQIGAPGRKTVSMQIDAQGPGRPAMVTVPTLEAGNDPTEPVVVPKPTPAASPKPKGAQPPPLQPYQGEQPKPGDRKSPALFWTGVGLVTSGGLAAVLGGIAWGLDGLPEPPPGAIVSFVGAGVFLAVGIPFMAVGGRRNGPEAALAPRLEPVVMPTGAGLKLTF
jgi:hypothetical protein